MIASETALSNLLTDNGYRVLRNGWPDLLVVPPDGSPGFAVELKSGRDKVRPHQKEMHDALEAAGVRVVVTKVDGVERVPPQRKEPLTPEQKISAALHFIDAQDPSKGGKARWKGCQRRRPYGSRQDGRPAVLLSGGSLGLDAAGGLEMRMTS